MLTCFPAGCDDELDVSIIARYCARKPYASKREFREELFGSRDAVWNSDLMSNIAHIIRQLPPGHYYSVDQFINRHTLLPYYALFLEPSQSARLYEDMSMGRGAGMNLRVGFAASIIPQPPFLKLCLACVEYDRQKEGFCYWHRKHQPFGVEVCATHNLPLLHTDVLTSNRHARYGLVTAEEALERADSIIEKTSLPSQDIFFALACSAAWSLEQSGWSPGLAFIHKRYRAILEQRYLITTNKRIRMSGIIRRFETMYSRDLQRQLHCILEGDILWIDHVLSNRLRYKHPLYHFLLIHLLGHSAESFFIDNQTMDY